jgi:hypothetical protein
MSPILLSDLTKMTDADLIANASHILYDERNQAQFVAFSREPENEEEHFALTKEDMESLRRIIDELEHRWVISKMRTRVRQTAKETAPSEVRNTEEPPSGAV